MDSSEVVDAFRQIREGGLELVAIAHSHPGTEPVPSPVDLEEAHYPDAAMVVVSFRDEHPEVCGWQLFPGEEPPYRPIRIVADRNT